MLIELAEYKREIGAAVTVAILLAVALGAIAIYSFPGAATGTLTTSASNSQSSTSTAPPCGSPGACGGSITLSSGRLTVDGDSSELQVTLAEVGNSYVGSATVYIDGTVIGVPPASEYEPPGNIALNVQPGQDVILALTIPSSTISIQQGKTYSVLVYSWLGSLGQRASAGLPASINITAT